MRIAVAAVAAIVLFGLSGVLLHFGFYTHDLIADTPLYQHYGNAIADGKVPYRDFEVEYPPGALPMFALPGLFRPGPNGSVSSGFVVPSRHVDVRRGSDPCHGDLSVEGRHVTRARLERPCLRSLNPAGPGLDPAQPL
jgi:hypothetical protein